MSQDSLGGSTIRIDKSTIVVALVLIYVISMTINATICIFYEMQIIAINRYSFSIIGLGIFAILSVWIGITISLSSESFVFSSLLCFVLMVFGYTFFRHQTDILFWLLCLGWILSIFLCFFLKLRGDFDSPWKFAATIIFVFFTIFSFLLPIAEYAMPDLASNIVKQLEYLPVDDLINARVAATVGFIAMAAIFSATQSIKTFTFQFWELFPRPQQRTTSKESILAPFIDPLLIFIWIFLYFSYYVSNSALSLGRSIVAFLFDIGKNIVGFIVDIITNAKLWISFIQTSYVLLAIGFVSYNIKFVENIIIRLILDHSLNFELLMMNLAISVSFLVFVFIIASFLTIWRVHDNSGKGFSLCLNTSVRSSVSVFLCIWLASVTSYAINMIFDLHELAFRRIGIFMLIGLVSIGIGLVYGMKSSRASSSVYDET